MHFIGTKSSPCESSDKNNPNKGKSVPPIHLANLRTLLYIFMIYNLKIDCLNSFESLQLSGTVIFSNAFLFPVESADIFSGIAFGNSKVAKLDNKIIERLKTNHINILLTFFYILKKNSSVMSGFFVF